MKIVSRRLAGYGDAGTPTDEIDVRVKPETAVAGVWAFVAAGIITHVAVRFIDRWLFEPRGS